MSRLAAVLACAFLAAACGGAAGVVDGAGSWEAIEPSPLSARNGSVGAWTGRELLVVGGTTTAPCPVRSTCDMEVPTGRRDGAAFDPADGTWRTIAPSPAPIFEAPTAWSGKRLVVLTSKATLAYDPVADAWETWEPPPDIEVNQIVPTDKGLLFVGYSSRGPDSADWLLAEGAWQALPRDPFGESYDRSVAWDGDRYWLLSMAVEHHFEASNGTSSRVAVLSDGGWQAVSDSTPDLGYGQRWWIVGDRLVAPPRGAGKAAYFDLGSHTWTSAPVEEDRECALPAVGAGAGWVGGGGSLLLAASTKEILRVPPCPALARPDLAVWADDELLVWGGVSSDSENQAVGLRWRPPAP